MTTTMTRVDAPVTPHRSHPTPQNLRVAPARPARPARIAPSTPRRVSSVSYRGRRTFAAPVDRTQLMRVAGLVALLAMVLVGALAISSVTTKQTYQIAQLESYNAQLTNQLETLNREVELQSSSAAIARRAADMGMVVADQPGIIMVDNNGAQHTVREPDPTKTHPIIDVSGATLRPNVATSNPQETSTVNTNNNTLPAPPVPGAAELPAVAPYAPVVRGGQAGGNGQ